MKTKIPRPSNKISTPAILNIKEDLSKPIELMTRLVQKEIDSCAQLIGIETEELQAWIDLQVEAPAKTLLHLLRTAKQYELDPLQDEMLLTQYDDQWQVSISVDGWIKLINRHPAFAGMAFTESPENKDGLPLWMECTIYRVDRAIPITAREYLAEVKNDSDIWKKMPRRMLRHRALQQCARLAMGIVVKSVDENDLANSNKRNDSLLKITSYAVSSKNLCSQSDNLKNILKQNGSLL